MNCPLPQGKTGKHVIYNVWQRSDSPEAFYACIDVSFSGAVANPGKRWATCARSRTCQPVLPSPCVCSMPRAATPSVTA